jgi:Na+-translocating ferredoxin:NAD+ oxidoreductase RnfG subunit
MNKLVKLPLFLASIALIAGATLATVNYFTLPIIIQREQAALNAGYLRLLGIDDNKLATLNRVPESGTISAETDLSVKGINDYVMYENKSDNSLYGIVYNGTVTGYNTNPSDPIIFQVGFKEGVFAGYNDVSNKETGTYGGKYLKDLDDVLKGVAANDEIAFRTALNQYKSDNLLSVTITERNLVPALWAAASHYVGLIGAGDVNQPYIDALNIDDLSNLNRGEMIVSEGELADVGVSGFTPFVNSSNRLLFGVVYEGEITGDQDQVIFKLGYKNDEFANFVYVENEELNDGQQLLTNLSSLIKGSDVSSINDVIAAIDDYIDVNNLTGITTLYDNLVSLLEKTSQSYIQYKHDYNVSLYLEAINESSASGLIFSEPILATDSLFDAGIVSYVTIRLEEDDSLFAVVYYGKVAGYSATDDIEFMVGFKDGKFAGYNSLGHSESASVGGILINNLNDLIIDIAANDQAAVLTAINEFIGNDSTLSYLGVTITLDPILDVLFTGAEHYLQLLEDAS